MSPRAKHVPDGARPTTICLTDEDHAALNWIKFARGRRGEDRKTLNDIFVDSLWYLLEKVEGKRREDILATVPPRSIKENPQGNITEMPKAKGK